MVGKEQLVMIPRILFTILMSGLAFVGASIPCAYMVWAGVQAQGAGGVVPQSDFMMVMIVLMGATLAGGVVGYESWPGLLEWGRSVVRRFR